ELRELVREVLSEVLSADVGGRRGHAPSAHRTPPSHTPGALSRAAPPPGALSPGPLYGDHDATGRPGLGQPRLAHRVREDVESVETVSLRTDDELRAFVLRLLHLFENPKQRDAVRAGRLRFRLAAGVVPGSVRPAHRVEKGAVTEAMVGRAAEAGARL